MKFDFKIVVLIIFSVFAVIGLFVFSGAIPIGSKKDTSKPQGSVVMWGTVRSSVINPLLEDFNLANQTVTVRYIEKTPTAFDGALLEALASGSGPDMFLITDELAYKYSNKIFPIPYTSLSESTFKNTFAGAGEVFMTSKGVLAFPLAVDPMMMYYNRSMLDANTLPNPPLYWDELAKFISVLNKKDQTGKLTKSAIALGQFANINHAKEIISTLFMQAGNPLIREESAFFNTTLDQKIGSYNLPSVLDFYTKFADPEDPAYSWNRGFPNSREAFSKEDLAIYFGLASELNTLFNTNPNQNFAMTSMPQIRDAKFKLTGGHVTGIAISAFSKNINTAFAVSGMLADKDFASRFVSALRVAPARRDLLAIPPNDAYSPSFYSSAFYTKSWLDPAPVATNTILKEMIENVLSGLFSTTESINDAATKLRLLFVSTN